MDTSEEAKIEFSVTKVCAYNHGNNYAAMLTLYSLQIANNLKSWTLRKHAIACMLGKNSTGCKDDYNAL